MHLGISKPANVKYGGVFPWVGLKYNVKIQGGLSPLSLLNKLGSYFLLRDLSFEADGSLRRWKTSTPIRMGRLSLCWYWDATEARIVINFFVESRCLHWRWDELRPVTVGSSQEWQATAYVGKLHYSYSLKLDLEDSLEIIPRTESILVNDGSVCFDYDVDEYDISNVDIQPDAQRGDMDQLAKLIDGMWVQELVLQCTAEWLTSVVQAAARVQEGEDAATVIQSCLEHGEEVRGWAEESLKVRAQARGKVAFEGGKDEILQTINSQLNDAFNSVRPLIDQLSSLSGAEEVKVTVTRMLANLDMELQAINEVKEANTSMYMQFGQNLSDLECDEWAFTGAVFQAAEANPENKTLQRGAVKALLKTMSSFRSHDEYSRSVLLNGTQFVCSALTKDSQDAAMQRLCCSALAALVKQGADFVERITSFPGFDAVLKALTSDFEDTSLKADVSLLLETLGMDTKVASPSQKVRRFSAVRPLFGLVGRHSVH